MVAFGRSPQFGDSSDARVLLLDEYYTADPLDHSFLARLARAALPEDEVALGEKMTALFPDSGYAFHREDLYGLCLAASPVGAPGHSGHHHLDKTSMVLRVGNQPVFVDSGTLCYTPDTRLRLVQRSTRAHNVVMVDGEEQGEIAAEGVFDPPRRLRPWLRSAAPGSFELGHDGYARFPGLGPLERRIRCSPTGLRIEEELAGRGPHAVEILFHLHPGVEARVEERAVSAMAGDQRLCRLELPEGFVPSFETAGYSVAYGDQEPHRVLVLSRQLELPAVVRYAIGVSGQGT
jgi:hypothetical protein